MCAQCDPPGCGWSTRVPQVPAATGRGDLASSVGYHGGAGKTAGASLPARYRMLAAGVAVLVALCLAWAGTARIMSVPAMPGGPAVRVMALVRFAGHAGGVQRPGAASARPGPDGIRVLSQVGPGRPGGLAGVLPPGVLGEIPSPGCVAAGADGPSLVAGPPGRGCKACGDIGGSGGSLGCGDRASLPGRPARYRVIWLVCPRCGATTPQMFYDERDLPLCASSADTPHGPMELQR